jgi:hypothetical protein
VFEVSEYRYSFAIQTFAHIDSRTNALVAADGRCKIQAEAGGLVKIANFLT